MAAPEVAPPVENPVPVQDVALVEDQESVEEPPEVMLVGLAANEEVGAGGGAVTVTVALLFTEPPAPVHASEYVVEVFGETTTDPDVALPVENPVPVQELVFEDVQLSVDELPETTLVGLAEKLEVGAGPRSVTVSVMVFVPFEENDLLALELVPKTFPDSLHE